MLQYAYCFFIVFFLTGIPFVSAQVNVDSVDMPETNSDSLYQPIPDRNDMPADAFREVPAKRVATYLKDADYAYANDPDYWKRQAPPKPGLFYNFLNHAVFRWTIFLAVIGIVLFGIYQLAKENNFKWFTRKGQSNSPGTPDVLPDPVLNYELDIRTFQEAGNYRLAVRCMYLRMIDAAGKKGGIRFRDSSTNGEIALAFGNHPLAGDFRYLARAYEYIFYGHFIPDTEMFNMLKNRFETFQQRIFI
jgi:Domain of unknown function (DUF4129)